jgi:hypothetical protein
MVGDSHKQETSMKKNRIIMMLSLIISFQYADNQADSRKQHMQSLHAGCSSLLFHNLKFPVNSMKSTLEKMGNKLTTTEMDELLPTCSTFCKNWKINNELGLKKMFHLNAAIYTVGIIAAMNKYCSFSDLKMVLPLFTLGTAIGSLLNWVSVLQFNKYVENQAQKKESLIREAAQEK